MSEPSPMGCIGRGRVGRSVGPDPKFSPRCARQGVGRSVRPESGSAKTGRSGRSVGDANQTIDFAPPLQHTDDCVLQEEAITLQGDCVARCGRRCTTISSPPQIGVDFSCKRQELSLSCT